MFICVSFGILIRILLASKNCIFLDLDLEKERERDKYREVGTTSSWFIGWLN